MQSTVIYVYDALCGWCYGFSPVMKRLQENFHDTVGFRVVSGGMVLGERAGEIGKVAPYIKGAYKRVEELSGVVFGQPFLDALDEGSMLFSSDAPSRALTLFRRQHPEQQVAFAHALQSAIYSAGLPPVAASTYETLAAQFGIPDPQGFANAMNAPDVHKETASDYAEARQLQANGFPAVYVKHGSTYYKIAHGFTDYASLEARLQQVLSSNDQPA